MKKCFAILLLLTTLVAFAETPPAKSLRIATVSQPQLIRPQAAALNEINRLARLAKLDGAELALFPEVIVNGFDPADSAYELPDGPAYRQLGKIAAELKLYLAVGMKIRDDKNLKRNALVVFSPEGKAIYTYYKCFMPPDELIASVPAPVEQPVWNSPWGKIGMAICWDMNCDALFAHYARENVKLILFSTYIPAGRILNQRCFELGMHAVSSHAQGFDSYMVDDIGRTTATADMFSPVMTRTINL
ncbi:MAG: carbon-nitrogen hydrolase family protein, partial [Victivallaceae bacterium]